MTEVVEGSMLPWIATSGALVSLGVFALVLAALGVFAVSSQAVASRISEIGIRRALGAQTTDVLRIVFRQGVKLVLIGLIAGLLLSAGLLYGIGSLEVQSHVLVLVVLLGAAISAIALPAIRATRVDPIVALRDE